MLLAMLLASSFSWYNPCLFDIVTQLLDQWPSNCLFTQLVWLVHLRRFWCYYIGRGAMVFATIVGIAICLIQSSSVWHRYTTVGSMTKSSRRHLKDHTLANIVLHVGYLKSSPPLQVWSISLGSGKSIWRNSLGSCKSTTLWGFGPFLWDLASPFGATFWGVVNPPSREVLVYFFGIWQVHLAQLSGELKNPPPREVLVDFFGK